MVTTQKTKRQRVRVTTLEEAHRLGVSVLCAEEVAKILRCGRGMVYSMMLNGELDYLQLGHKKLISVVAVERKLAGGQ